MDKLTPKEREEVISLIRQETGYFARSEAGNVGSWLANVEATALLLHKLYESACSDDLGAEGNAERTARTVEAEEHLEAEFKRVGLGLYLNGDPRGNPVGILTPVTGKYNTMGGREDGWRL